MQTTKNTKAKSQKNLPKATHKKPEKKVEKVLTKEEKNKLNEDLKNSILLSEKKRDYSSDKFSLIEEQVKASLSKQDTDEALKSITI